METQISPVAKTPRQPRVGKNRLFKQANSPFYNFRVMRRGTRRQFSTGETTWAKAEDKARAILADIKSKGLDEAVRLHARRVDLTPEDPTIEEFVDIYRAVISCVDCAPSHRTSERYIKSLRLVANAVDAKRIRALSPEKVKRFMVDYQDRQVRDGHVLESVKVSLNSLLRNTASMFSEAAIAGYADHGLVLTNPFKGVKLRRVAIKGFTPLKPEMLESIWKNAGLLRDGDSHASELPPRTSRWGEPDWRNPHKEAYVLLLLELGLGLRRHESDKAEWDWIFSDGEGRKFLEVKPTPYFSPKSGERRILPLSKEIYDALVAMKADEKFIVAGRSPKIYPPGKQPKNIVYRCDMYHRVLAKWLRKQGINAGNPCHVLRKQFGSYVATTFGLYHAQKFLGHSSPKVTSDYYAGLVELPEINHHQLGSPVER